MPAFTLRTARAQDETAVTALLQACYPILMAADYEPEVLDPALKIMCQANPELLASNTYYLVATSGGDIVGCGGWTRARPGSGETQYELAHIRHFATHPTHLRQGIAAAIIAKCFDMARVDGIEKLECYSSRSAVAFYKSQGFQVLNDIDIPFTPDLHFPSVHMECDMSS